MKASLKTKKVDIPKATASNLNPRKIKIRVIGLGGGGTAIVNEMAQDLPGVSFVVADTDERVFKAVKNKGRVKPLQFGQKILNGMGTGMNPDIAQKAALEEKEKISKIFEGQDLVILVGALGGGVASGAGPVFADLSRHQKNNIVLGFFTLPFVFEGEQKMRLAQKAVNQLRANLSAIVVVPNERIFQVVEKKTPLKKSLSLLNRMFADWLVDLVEVISRPSLINIDFADLKAILKGQGESLFFGQAITQGPNRVEEAIKKIFHNPLLTERPTNIQRILFNIAGWKDLTIKEVEQASKQIALLNEKAKIIFGISQQSKYQGKIKITLLALGDNEKKEASKEEKAKAFLEKQSKLNKAKKNQKGKNKILAKNNLQKGEKISNSKDSPMAFRKPERRSALEIKQASQTATEKEWGMENDWEVPAFFKDKTNQ